MWRGTGEVVYPTIDGPYAMGQQLVFAHDGRPFLSYESRAWLLGPDGEVLRPAAREVGFWRPRPDGEIEVLLTHATGITEIYYGRARNLTSWEIDDRRGGAHRVGQGGRRRRTGSTGWSRAVTWPTWTSARWRASRCSRTSRRGSTGWPAERRATRYRDGDVRRVP